MAPGTCFLRGYLPNGRTLHRENRPALSHVVTGSSVPSPQRHGILSVGRSRQRSGTGCIRCGANQREGAAMRTESAVATTVGHLPHGLLRVRSENRAFSHLEKWPGGHWRRREPGVGATAREHAGLPRDPRLEDATPLRGPIPWRATASRSRPTSMREPPSGAEQDEHGTSKTSIRHYSAVTERQEAVRDGENIVRPANRMTGPRPDAGALPRAGRPRPSPPCRLPG
jgi:hypothetical protein